MGPGTESGNPHQLRNRCWTFAKTRCGAVWPRPGSPGWSGPSPLVPQAECPGLPAPLLGDVVWGTDACVIISCSVTVAGLCEEGSCVLRGSGGTRTCWSPQHGSRSAPRPHPSSVTGACLTQAAWRVHMSVPGTQAQGPAAPQLPEGQASVAQRTWARETPVGGDWPPLPESRGRVGRSIPPWAQREQGCETLGVLLAKGQ